MLKLNFRNLRECSISINNFEPKIRTVKIRVRKCTYRSTQGMSYKELR
jgi:hypothetical protein